ncbi:MAG: calcium/sodium antiporter [Dehalococcoidia bacterium]|jgi:cation:H+ antiporter|nr:calcium/sodium antiporter [Dehalococcoidia bacterium]
MTVDLLLVAGGLTVLLAGAWQVVRSAVVIALMFGLSRVVVGATVVAFGTSAPEFVISFIAALEGSSGLAFGNVLGSNVANVALVLGSAALVAPLIVNARLVQWEIPVLIAATAAVLLFGANGTIGRLEGGLLFLGGLLGFIFASLLLVPSPSVIDGDGEEDERPPKTATALSIAGGLLLVGLTALAVGAAVAVEGATGIAQRVGMSELAVGVSIVAVGTSLPEVATSLMAAMRREHDIAVAAVVGSNIFNLLGVIGATALITPLTLDRSLYDFEMPVLALSSLILVPLVMWWSRHLVDRREGALLVVLYVGFLFVIVSRA